VSVVSEVESGQTWLIWLRSAVYENLGFQWASSLLGFLALACVPMP
jgi:hypothetical protein